MDEKGTDFVPEDINVSEEVNVPEEHSLESEAVEDSKKGKEKKNTGKKSKDKKIDREKSDKGKPDKGNSDKTRRSLTSRFDLLNRFKHWYMGGISITRSMFRVRAAWQGVIIISVILAGLFILSAFYTGAGEFVISLDSTMSRDGFFLSNSQDFNERLVCLRSNAVVADNISVFDIKNDINDLDGINDGANYVAHTFYLTNETGKTKDYQYRLVIRNSSKNAEKALWVMVFHNGVQNIYAMANEDGEPEKQYSIYDFPFAEYAENKEQYNVITDGAEDVSNDTVYQAQSINRVNELVATPFISEDTICQGPRKEMENGEVDKYTVVMWYEGEDPDCNDQIIGGWVEVFMEFEYLE